MVWLYRFRQVSALSSLPSTSREMVSNTINGRHYRIRGFYLP